MDMPAWSIGSAAAAWRTILPLSRGGSRLSVIVTAGISWQGLLMSNTGRDAEEPDWMIVLHSSFSGRSPETIADSWKMGRVGGKVSLLAFLGMVLWPVIQEGYDQFSGPGWSFNLR